MTEIWVAVVAAISAVTVALVERGRRENKRDHATVVDRLDLVSSEIRKDVRQVRTEVAQTRKDLTDQLRDHVNGPEHRPKPTRRKSA